MKKIMFVCPQPPSGREVAFSYENDGRRARMNFQIIGVEIK